MFCLQACLHLHVHAWCQWRTEEAVCSPGTSHRRLWFATWLLGMALEKSSHLSVPQATVFLTEAHKSQAENLKSRELILKVDVTHAPWCCPLKQFRILQAGQQLSPGITHVAGPRIRFWELASLQILPSLPTNSSAFLGSEHLLFCCHLWEVRHYTWGFHPLCTNTVELSFVLCIGVPGVKCAWFPQWTPGF